MKKIGFIGGGNMGRAIIEGLINSGLYQPQDIWLYDSYQPTMEKLKESLHIQTANKLEDIPLETDSIILAVKPNVLLSVLASISKAITSDKIVISIAAGISISQLSQTLTDKNKIVRVMPNTPALVGEGMSAITVNDNLTNDEITAVKTIFNSFGKAEIVSESLIDAVIGVSGSAPAYVYMFIEALADGAVAEGLSRELAYQFAAQAVLGSAKMVLETGKHPGELKDMVCSPGGTTIEAVRSLEKNGFRSAVIEAVKTAAEKNRLM